MEETYKNWDHNFHQFAETVKPLSDLLWNIYYFFADFNKNVNHIVTNVLKWIYDTLSWFVLHTPEFLIDNDWFSKITHTYTILSILLMAVVVLYRILININENKSLKEWEFCKRVLIALTVSCLTPQLLKYGVRTVNFLTDSIISIGSSFFYTNVQSLTLSHIAMSHTFSFEGLTLLLFMGIYILTCVPIVLRAGIRWFEIISLGAITPFAMTAWIFDEHRNYHRMWWGSLKDRLLSQLVHAIFVTFIGLLIFSTPTPESFSGLMMKLLVVGGGLWKMIFPPKFIVSQLDSGDNVIDVHNKSKKNITDRLKDIKEKKDIVKNSKLFGAVSKMMFKK